MYAPKKSLDHRSVDGTSSASSHTEKLCRMHLRRPLRSGLVQARNSYLWQAGFRRSSVRSRPDDSGRVVARSNLIVAPDLGGIVMAIGNKPRSKRTTEDRFSIFGGT
jgi:hypothetical protein